MAQTRTRKPATPKLETRDDAIVVLGDVAVTLPTSAAIARMLASDGTKERGKTIRGAIRSGIVDADGNVLPPVHVSKQGESALTDAHKRAIVARYAPQDADACVKLATKVAGK